MRKPFIWIDTISLVGWEWVASDLGETELNIQELGGKQQ
jgi:hypothetical protein